ncbi:hypothetical protein [Halomicrococcus sp. SG-WS-1]|uniref:hypothetical protein n=1 Tax=Halomicrococcus sp. SG-WS-1 TaxID=3439057 RepID=UPI003F79F88E
MLSFYLLARLGIVAGYYLLRLVPVVGMRLSDDYENRMFGPLVDDVSVADVRASSASDLPTNEQGGDDRSPTDVVVAVTLDNDSSLDARVAGGHLRLGLAETGATCHNFVWTEEFDEPPANVAASKVDAEGDGTLRLECRVHDLPPDADLWLDGELVLQRLLTVRDRELPLGKASFGIEGESTSVDRTAGAPEPPAAR